MKNKNMIMFFSLVVAVLNVFDGIATNYGLKNHLTVELNPLMNHLIILSPTIFLFIKISLSILILFFSYKVIKNSKPVFQTLYFYAVVGLSIIYFGIFSIHIFWMTTLTL